MCVISPSESISLLVFVLATCLCSFGCDVSSVDNSVDTSTPQASESETGSSSPEDNGRVLSFGIIFRWEELEGASSYELTIWQDDLSTEFTQGETSATGAFIGFLPEGRQYYWLATGLDEAGTPVASTSLKSFETSGPQFRGPIELNFDNVLSGRKWMLIYREGYSVTPNAAGDYPLVFDFDTNNTVSVTVCSHTYESDFVIQTNSTCSTSSGQGWSVIGSKVYFNSNTTWEDVKFSFWNRNSFLDTGSTDVFGGQ